MRRERRIRDEGEPLSLSRDYKSLPFPQRIIPPLGDREVKKEDGESEDECLFLERGERKSLSISVEGRKVGGEWVTANLRLTQRGEGVVQWNFDILYVLY